MMCLNGTTTGHSTAIGVNSHLDVGAAVIGTKSQTGLASQYNPGPKPSDGVVRGIMLLSAGGLNTLIGLIALTSGGFGTCLFILLITAPCMVIGFNYATGKKQKSEIEAWEQKNILFETGWICHKCGINWTP